MKPATFGSHTRFVLVCLMGVSLAVAGGCARDETTTTTEQVTEAAFDEVETKYGTIENYFSEALGIDAAQDGLRDLYLSQEQTSLTDARGAEALSSSPPTIRIAGRGEQA